MPDENSKNESLSAQAITGVVTVATAAIGTIGAIVFYAGGGDKSKEKN